MFMIIGGKGYTPEPTEWDPDHETLHAEDAPYETPGVLQMMRSGKTGEELVSLLYPDYKTPHDKKLAAWLAMKQIEEATEQETAANEAGRPIHP